MAEALRTLLCEFLIEVDKAGELKRGNAQIESLKDRLHELQTQALQSSKAVQDVFSRAATAARINIQAIGAGQLGGRAGFGADGFAAAGAARAALATKAADEAAQRYAQTLRGRFSAAIASARADLGKGGPGGGGLVQSLFSLRTAFIGLGVGAALRGAVGLVDRVGGIGEAAAKLGTSTDDFQRLSILAEQNATSVETLGTAFKTLANSAVQPTKESAAAFQALGVSTKDSAGQFKSSQALFWESAEALAGVANETERSALAQDLFGRSAQELKPILSGGSEAVRKQREELMKLRLLSPETIAAADRLSDSWVVMKAQLLTAAEPLIRLLIPSLERLGKGLVAVVGFVKDFVDSGRAGRLAIVGLGLVTARYLPLLRMMIGLGGGFIPILARMALGMKAFGKTLLTTIAPLLILEDILGFFMGKDSLTGRGIEAAFGKDVLEGVQKTIGDLTEAFKDLWRWVFGDGAGEKAKSFFGELSLAIRLMVNDLLAAIPFSGRTAGLAGLESFERTEKARQDAGGGGWLGGIATDFVQGFTGTDISAPAIAAPGERQGVTYIDQKQISTQVTMQSGASPAAVAQTVSSAVQRSSSADLAALESE